MGSGVSLVKNGSRIGSSVRDDEHSQRLATNSIEIWQFHNIIERQISTTSFFSSKQFFTEFILSPLVLCENMESTTKR